MGPVLVVVDRVVGQDACELAAAEDEQPVEAFATQGPDLALGVRRAFGAWSGALITRMPCVRKTSSKSRVNLLSRSRIRYRGRTSWSSSYMSRFRACWATHSPSGFVLIPAR